VLFNALRRQDYATYANAMLRERQQMQFPPYVFMALLRAEARDFNLVQKFLSYAFRVARELNTKAVVYDPIRPQMERLKGMERGYVLMQAGNRGVLQALLCKLMTQLRGHSTSVKVRWAIDVDPLEF